MVGKTISHYKILEKLGGGGMGVVYKAEDTKLKRTVALKFLPQDLSRDDESKERFIHEAQAASALDHNNICTIYEIDETDDGQMFIAMACYDGETLKKTIGGGPLKLEDALDISLQISEGLSKAHEKEIVHRDLKPANVMLTKDGVVKILDFGLAKLRGQTKLTKVGTTLGTAPYMSPEQARGEEVDNRTDVFSLGVLLYEMLTGQLPFKGDYHEAIIYSILNEDQEPITGLRTGVPMELERIINKCLEKEPSSRYQQTNELAVDLQKVKKGLETKDSIIKSADSIVVPKKRVNQLSIGFGVVFVLLLSFLGYFMFTGEGETTERIPIAVVDFVNQTNEPELNGLSGLLITSLEQSRRLSVFSRARMFDVLRQMDRADVTFIDEATGREIAKREKVQALAVATIQKFDDLYVIEFKVIDPETGDRLFSTKEEGEGQRSIPAMIDRLSEKTRIDMKEQQETIQLASRGVADVTTTNMEAYNHYFEGINLFYKSLWRSAQREFEKAIALDSTFGLAYFRLADLSGWTSIESIDEYEIIKKAVTLIDRIPDKERYLVKALNTRIENGWRHAGMRKAINILKEMEKLYPDEKDMLFKIGDYAYHTQQFGMATQYFEKVLKADRKDNLVYFHLTQCYRDMKRYDKMLEISERWVSNIGNDFAYVHLALSYGCLGDLETGLKRLYQVRELFPDRFRLSDYIAYLHMVGLQFSKAENELKTLVESETSRESKLSGYDGFVDAYLYQGKYRKTIESIDKIVALEKETADSLSISSWYLEKAKINIYGWNNKQEAEQQIEESLAHLPKKQSDMYWSWLFDTYALVGDLDEAKKIATKHFEDNGIGMLEAANALIQIENGACEKAETLAEIVAQSVWNQLFSKLLYPLANCQFQEGEFDKSTNTLMQIQEVVQDHPHFGARRSIVFPKSFYLLGKIYEKKGDTQLAIQNYEKFLDLWKDADEDLPDLIDAKKRLAKLKEMSNKGS